MKEKRTLIACGIFQDEIEAVLRANKDRYAVKIIWLEVGLHDNIEHLEETLKETAAASRNNEDHGLRLMYGYGCAPLMKDLAQSLDMPSLSAKNCLAAMVGDEKLLELEQNRTMVITPAWVRKMWFGRLDTPLGWKADDFRINLGRYDRLLVLDAGINPLSDEETLNCFDLVEVPLETEPCDLSYFEKIFLELLA